MRPKSDTRYGVTILQECGVTSGMTQRQARDAVSAAGKKLGQTALVQALRELGNDTK